MPTKIRIVKAMVFPVVMYGCENWTIKKAECQKIDTFELWCWRSPLDSKEIQPVNPKENQSWVFTGRTDVEAETQTLWPPDSLEKTLMLGKVEDKRKKRVAEDGWDG